MREKVALLPPDMGEVGNLPDAFLYLYFCARYYDEHLFNVIMSRTNNFGRCENKDIIRLLKNPRAYHDMTTFDAGGTSNKLYKGSDQAQLN